MPEKTISFRIAIILRLFSINDGIQKWAILKFQALAKIYIFAIKYRLQVQALIIDEINDIITYTKRVPSLGFNNYLHQYTKKIKTTPFKHLYLHNQRHPSFFRRF